MSDEEKKAIEDLKRLRKGIEILNQITPEKDETDIKAIDFILNLIEKQQKEIKKYRNVILNLNNNWISKEELKNILEKLKVKEQEMSDEQGYWGGSELQGKIEIIEEILEDK